MLAALKKLFREWKGLKAFKRLSAKDRSIVIYSEGRGYWSYFEPIYVSLQSRHSQAVVYVTSAENDPLLLNPLPGMRAFYIGEGSVRTLFFATLEADVLLMTMPDLQSFHIKRSPFSVHYVYVHHSIVSTHMIYRAAAFDHFDSILCVGPHHIDETRAREAAYGLKPKALIEHGYGRLDTLLKERSHALVGKDSGHPVRVLVAPTWGENGVLERYGIDVIRPLIEAGCRVILRPHPRTRKLAAQKLEQILEHYREEPLFSLDEDGDGRASLLSSDLMLSDWSGAALEFAFGLERPVIFIDVPRKVLNNDYPSLGLEPLEVQVREQLGVVLSTDSLAQAGQLAHEMVQNSEKLRASICAARERWIFNSGTSGEVAASYLISLVNGRGEGL